MSKDPEAAKLIRLMLAKTLLVIVIVFGAVAFFMIAGPDALTGRDSKEMHITTASAQDNAAPKKRRMAIESEIGGDLLDQFSDMDAGLELPDLRFAREDGTFVNLSDYRGKVVLLNVWATWCAPCVVEMPRLDQLQGAYGGDDFTVIALSFDRDGIGAVVKFFEETEIDNLDVYADTEHDAQNKLIWGGLPMTILIDRDGREIGRLPGPADWYSDDAQELIKNAIAGKAG